jgi:hypothetical protein
MTEVQREIIGLTDWANTPLEYKIGPTRSTGQARILRQDAETGAAVLVPVTIVSDQELAQRELLKTTATLRTEGRISLIEEQQRQRRIENNEDTAEDHGPTCPECGSEIQATAKVWLTLEADGWHVFGVSDGIDDLEVTVYCGNDHPAALTDDQDRALGRYLRALELKIKAD